jgi:hypothetical protein
VEAISVLKKGTGDMKQTHEDITSYNELLVLGLQLGISDEAGTNESYTSTITLSHLLHNAASLLEPISLRNRLAQHHYLRVITTVHPSSTGTPYMMVQGAR